jgi:hypothetical protein
MSFEEWVRKTRADFYGTESLERAREAWDAAFEEGRQSVITEQNQGKKVAALLRKPCASDREYDEGY